MPKSYSDKEKEYIIKRLKEEAALCLKQYGIKKTTVDELVKRANIPKGTFYLFFKSKELLFFEVINEFHKSIQEKLLKEVEAFNGDITCEQLTEIFCGLYKAVDETAILRLVTTGEFELLECKIPENLQNKHHDYDDFQLERLISYIPTIKDKNIEDFRGAFRAVFLITLHKREIGEKCFDESLRLIIKGIILQLME